ncbi:MAG TPA: DUF2797 domain-containing protein [Thermoplasmata archaeon]|nr:DUF2797 domain-containing protein [Thermoplasmata archaeon]
MFERADRIWLEQVEASLPYHAVDFEWHGFEPVLTCAGRSPGDVLDVDLGRVDYIISSQKECVGHFEDGRYIACPYNAAVTKFVQCAACAKEFFIPYQECVFEPKCDGERCDMDFCRREHVLYLAFYNTRVKIGMSSTRRVDKRLVEQGADAFALIGSFPSRLRAREAEKQISSEFRIPQAYRQETLLDGLDSPVDIAGIEESYSSLCASFETQQDITPGKLRWLKSYPIELPLDVKPKLRETQGRHRGEAVGVKGRWLIYRADGLNALNLADIPSRFVGIQSPQ